MIFKCLLAASHNDQICLRRPQEGHFLSLKMQNVAIFIIETVRAKKNRFLTKCEPTTFFASLLEMSSLRSNAHSSWSSPNRNPADASEIHFLSQANPCSWSCYWCKCSCGVCVCVRVHEHTMIALALSYFDYQCAPTCLYALYWSHIARCSLARSVIVDERKRRSKWWLGKYVYERI